MFKKSGNKEFQSCEECAAKDRCNDVNKSIRADVRKMVDEVQKTGVLNNLKIIHPKEWAKIFLSGKAVSEEILEEGAKMVEVLQPIELPRACVELLNRFGDGIHTNMKLLIEEAVMTFCFGAGGPSGMASSMAAAANCMKLALDEEKEKTASSPDELPSLNGEKKFGTA